MNGQKQNDAIPADIAVIGMGCRFPGADNPDQYWQNIREGVESIRFFDDDELRAAGVPAHMLASPRYVPASAALQEAEDFDADYFGYVAREAELMDPQHRLFLECALWAMEDAGYDPARYPGLVGVYAGSTMNTYLLVNLIGNRRMLDAVGDHATMIGNDKDYLALRVAYKLNLQGPAVSVQSACSTSLTAIHLAAQAILAGECDMAIAGGASLRMPHNAGYLQNATASEDGHCRSFDADSTGSVVGNGAGAVLLKHLDDALRDGDHIHAVIAGTSIGNDGRAKASFTAPGVDGQARAAAGAIASAGLTADVIDYVEAHGTGTPLGDPIEVAGLTKAYRLTTDRSNYCAIGSVKPNIGHLDAAAGVAGFIKTVMCLKNKSIPPVLHFRTPNPEIDFASGPFYVPTELLPMEGEPGRPRYASVHSLGMGGANAHVVLREAPDPVVGAPEPGSQLVVLSARSRPALAERMEQTARWMRENPGAVLADVAHTLQVGRTEHEYRASVVARDLADAASALGAKGSGRVRSSETADEAGSVVFLFPGQGSQSVGMGAELHRTEPVFRDAVDECLALMPAEVADRLRPLLLTRRDPSADGLTSTDLAQPALFTVEYALARLLLSYGVEPAAMLGHSIGEYVAATLAGVFSLADALSVVAARGRMVAALPGGSMLGVPLPEARVRELIGDRELSIAAVNGSALVSVAGTHQEVDDFEAQLRADGVVSRRLKVSHAFHSAMLDPVLADFTAEVAKAALTPPAIPVVSGVTGMPLTDEQATDPGYWARQLRETVRFADGLREAVAAPGRVLIEVGPGRQLSALAASELGARSAPVATLMPAADQRGSEQAALLDGLAELWHQGVRIDWEHTHRHPRLRVPLPTYPFQRTRCWIDAAPDDAAVALEEVPRGPEEWIHRPRWVELPRATGGTGTTATTGTDAVPGAVLVLSDRSGVGAALGERLTALGSRVTLVDAGADPGAALKTALDTPGSRPDVVVHLRALDAAPADTVEQEQAAGLRSLLDILPAGGARPPRLLHVTRHVFDVTGEDPVRPGLATAVGLCRVVPQETSWDCRVLELDPRDPGGRLPETVADLLAELGDTASQASPVALRGRNRFVRAHVRVHAGNQVPSAQGTHLLVGGLGMIGRTLAAEILRDPAAHVVLYDRADPAALAPTARRQLEELRALGGDRLTVRRGDAEDTGALTAAVHEAARPDGRLAGVVYTPGMSVTEGIRSVLDSSPELFAQHMATKMTGLHALDAALEDVAYDRCLIVGSLSSLLGGVGGAAYTAANWYADTYVALRNRTAARRWTNVQWEHWREADTAGLRDAADCGPQEARQLYRLLTAVREDGPFTVCAADPDLREALARQAEAGAGAAARPADDGPAAPSAGTAKARPKMSVPYVAPRDETEEYVAGLWRDLLGIDGIGVRDSFFELGGQSLLAMQLVGRLRDAHGIELPLGEIFQEATVATIAQLIRAAGETPPAGGPKAAPAAGQEPATEEEPAADVEVGEVASAELEALLNEIEGLSSADVEAALGAEGEEDA
ncbi:putative modular polyketide synthase [Actinacidiphila reveromycinica]|uniref:Putative modular polyketide synthase n=1 Tax=Actinacidiphila reveromycinica TaxID=659352 RepID=A0A7U3V0D7_9ACTN|nr:type I polyketide synthase [Streptomyces sp. SN-593]BBB01992.1 putative modular polyketide synthase [Streptomyces sp. SN-593]